MRACSTRMARSSSSAETATGDVGFLVAVDDAGDEPLLAELGGGAGAGAGARSDLEGDDLRGHAALVGPATLARAISPLLSAAPAKTKAAQFGPPRRCKV